MNASGSGTAAQIGFWRRLRNAFRTGGTPSSSKTSTQPDWIIIGLGNPGSKYATTRHNAGILAVQLEPLHWQDSKGAHAEIARSYHEDANVAYIRSHYYMNESGKTIARLTKHWTLDPSRIVVVHDELDLPVGKVRIKQGGNHNGHNGLKSVDAALGTNAYIHVRVGIGRPAPGVSVVDHVLGPLPDSATMEKGLQLAHQAIELLPKEGLAKTQNIIHSQ